MINQEIKPLNNQYPDESWGGWKNFLKTCEIRRKIGKVVFYGKTNCNYIIFSDGTLIENFGYHGDVIMDQIEKNGELEVKNKIIQNYNKIVDLLSK